MFFFIEIVIFKIRKFETCSFYIFWVFIFNAIFCPPEKEPEKGDLQFRADKRELPARADFFINNVENRQELIERLRTLSKSQKQNQSPSDDDDDDEWEIPTTSPTKQRLSARLKKDPSPVGGRTGGKVWSDRIITSLITLEVFYNTCHQICFASFVTFI